MAKPNILEKKPEIRPCTGCGVCTISCPYNCIEMTVDYEGFIRPVINDQCVHCGLCVKTCLKFDSLLMNEGSFISRQKVYSYKNQNNDILLNSSSGGFVGRIYERYLEEGYKICGASFDNEYNNVSHKVLGSGDGISILLGSKYLPSNTESCLRKIKDAKDSRFVFVGSPCQVYGLDKWARLHNRRSQFVLIDFVCAGVPSYLLWNSYIDYIRKTHKIGNIQSVSFRDKESGWHRYGIRISGTEGEYYMPSAASNDIFFKIFLSDCCKQCSCSKSNCLLRTQNCFSDLRVGDYWGDQFSGDTSGVSVIIANTEAGEKLVSEMCLTEQPGGIMIGDLREPNALRSEVMSSLERKIPINEVEKIIFKETLFSRVRKILTRILNGK